MSIASKWLLIPCHKLSKKSGSHAPNPLDSTSCARIVAGSEENARRKGAQRHGGGQVKLDIQEIEIATAPKDEELLALSDALEKFAVRDNQKAELVKLRYFVGLTTEEAAQVLGISVPTADRWWNFSRAWLYEEIERQQWF